MKDDSIREILVSCRNRILAVVAVMTATDRHGYKIESPKIALGALSEIVGIFISVSCQHMDREKLLAEFTAGVRRQMNKLPPKVAPRE